MTLQRHIEDCHSIRRKCHKYIQRTCSVKTFKKRVPILTWLPNYNVTCLIQDTIAGVTVGLTAIAQGMAYAAVAGLSPEYGLYAGLMGGFVYLFFGGCKDVSVGPTAIMSALVARYISGYSTDFAILAAFLAGLTELAMGILHLGFLVQYISQPVISGFTNAAALQIASSQFKSLFGLDGSAGNYFAESIYSFFQNIKTAQLWDPVLGFSTIFVLVLLKWLGQGCSRTDGVMKKLRWYISLSRNAIVVFIGILVAYILKVTTCSEPFTVIGKITSGLPKFSVPPFNTVVGNETYTFIDMVEVLGPKSLVLPVVSVLEIVAIGSAFSDGVPIDASQEMIALGLCNIIGSFASSMPVTGSFTRAALNHASGVQTPAGGIFTGCLIILSLSLMTTTFYFIPKPTLAALIITAMFSMMDYTIFVRLWKGSKRELTVSLITAAVCLFLGLEYGIVTGIAVDAVILLFSSSRPTIQLSTIRSAKGEINILLLPENLSYCAAEHVRRAILRTSRHAKPALVIIDGKNLRNIDSTVASNIISVVNDLEKKSVQILLLNFDPNLKSVCLNISPKLEQNFVTALNPLELYNTFPRNDGIFCTSC